MEKEAAYRIIDNFLPAALHQGLLAHALASEAAFAPSQVRSNGDDLHKPASRESWFCSAGLGDLASEFKLAVEATSGQLLHALGIPAFPIALVELELAAHRHGGYFRTHIDTFYGGNREGSESDRICSLVYYCHAEPRPFSGGELAVYPLGLEGPELLAPVGNRLVAFPSFTWHEVKPVACPPGDAFADARFSVNCWLHRARRQGQDL